ncbi:hypothetical protein EDO6_02625 [Paenibacillus xylanexedens]|nr:hypothetical protein EDO6_02625 [Paenibacillus xylanexedens]
MFRILLRKFLEVFIFLLFIMFVSFLFIRLAPGDPVLTILNVDELSVSQEQVEAVREEMGFNDSLPVQFGNWLLDFVRLVRRVVFDRPACHADLDACAARYG